MRNQSSVKQEFLRKWITGLRRCTSQKKNMSFLERKKAIKLSADLAMASTRDKTTRWSQALIAKASRDDNNNNKVITEHVIGSSSPSQNNKVSKNNYCTSTNNSTTRSSSSSSRSRIIRSKKILRRIRTVPKAKEERVAASFIAKRLVQKRTRKLRSLLPGGEFMDEVSLVEETLDYIESLRAQVEVMRCLVTASELFINNPSS